MIDGERRLAGHDHILGGFGSVNYLFVERIGRQCNGSDQRRDERKNRGAPGFFADQRATSSADGGLDSADHSCNESHDVTDCEGCGVADPKESVIQEFSPEPEALHLPVIQFV